MHGPLNVKLSTIILFSISLTEHDLPLQNYQHCIWWWCKCCVTGHLSHYPQFTAIKFPDAIDVVRGNKWQTARKWSAHSKRLHNKKILTFYKTQKRPRILTFYKNSEATQKPLSNSILESDYGSCRYAYLVCLTKE